MPGYRDLTVWRKSMELAKQVYQVSSRFPKTEIYGLVSQIRRAAVSVPSNIAEGHGRESDGDFNRFLSIANGSLREVETQLLLAVDLDFASSEEIKPILQTCTEVAKLINGFKKYLHSRQSSVDSRQLVDERRPTTKTDD